MRLSGFSTIFVEGSRLVWLAEIDAKQAPDLCSEGIRRLAW